MGTPPPDRAADATLLLALLNEIDELPYLSPAIKILPGLIAAWAQAVEDKIPPYMGIGPERKPPRVAC